MKKTLRKHQNPYSLLIFIVLLVFPLLASAMVTIKDVRSSVTSERTRFVFDLSQSAKYNLFTLKNPDRLVIDVEDGKWAGHHKPTVSANSVVNDVRIGQHGSRYLRFVFDLKHRVTPVVFMLDPLDGLGHRLVLDLKPAKSQAKLVPMAPEPKPSKHVTPKKTKPTAIEPVLTSSVASASKATKPRDIVVVIDPGHGGKDPGATGPGGHHEKNVVIKIAKDLQRMINATPGFKAELTRKGDYYITLRGRLAIASRDHADMFVSIHADAFKNPQAVGASVFALSERGATSEAARWLANRENRSELAGGVDLADKDNALRSVLINLAQTHTIGESLKIGNSILQQLSKVTKMHHYRVEQAAFVVLKSPDIPSLLVETGFLSNPGEERRLISQPYQEKIARAIKQGIVSYFVNHPPRGTYLAAKRDGRMRG